MNTQKQNKRYRARPRFQREFMAWFFEARRKFIAPLKITKRTKNSIELEFVNGQSLINVAVHTYEILVCLKWQGEPWWDGLKEFEAYPERTKNGYVCYMCDPTERETFSSREALWHDHLFQPFLEWVNNTLVRAPWIEVCGHAETYRYAELRVSLPETREPYVDQDEIFQIIDNPLYTNQDSNRKLPMSPKS